MVPTAITTSMQWTPHTHTPTQPLTGCYVTTSAETNREQRTGEGDEGQCKGSRCTTSAKVHVTLLAFLYLFDATKISDGLQYLATLFDD